MSINGDIEMVYEDLVCSDGVYDYDQRHGVRSLTILTICSPEEAWAVVLPFQEQIRDKVVVEIGAGVGFAALEMAKYAKTVYAIEADPAWSWAFTRNLYKTKPSNLTWIFGSAQEMMGKIKADVAVVFTRSDQEGMAALAKQFAPEVIEGHGRRCL